MASESTPAPAFDKQSSVSSSSSTSYESSFQVDAAGPTDGCPPFFSPPSMQTMAAQPEVFDQSRIPSAAFRAKPASPTAGDWSVNSNESLFSIKLGRSGEISALFHDFYDTTIQGFSLARLESDQHDDWKLSAVMETSGSGGHDTSGLSSPDCVRCSGIGKSKKLVMFAADAGSTSGNSAVFPTLADALEETKAPAPARSTIEGSYALGCCWFACWWWSCGHCRDCCDCHYSSCCCCL